MIKFVKKDSGYRQKFSLEKLTRSIAEALRHGEAEDIKVAQSLAHETREYLEGQNKNIIDVDEIRQAVLHIMKQHQHHPGAASYEFSSLHLKKSAIGEVAKKTGGRQSFHPYKLFKSIKKSFADAGIRDSIKISEELTKEAIARLEKEYAGKSVPAQEIRKITAQLLKEKGFKQVERSYLLHKYL